MLFRSACMNITYLESFRLYFTPPPHCQKLGYMPPTKIFCSLHHWLMAITYCLGRTDRACHITCDTITSSNLIYSQGPFDNYNIMNDNHLRQLMQFLSSTIGFADQMPCVTSNEVTCDVCAASFISSER